MYLLFDIGGTNMRIGVSKDGNTIDAVTVMPVIDDFNAAMEILEKEAKNLLGGHKPQGIGIGLPGTFNRESGSIINLPNLFSWNEKPIVGRLKASFDCPVFLENDAALAGLGEAVFGSGKDKEIIAYLTVSTGIGGSRIVKGKIDESAFGFEPGHQIIIFNGQCVSLENCVSGPAIERIYKQDPAGIKDPEIWDEIASILAIGLNNTIVHWSPEMVILGGSVMKSLPIEKVRAELRERVKIFKVLPELILARLGDQVGLYGALAYCKSQEKA